MGLENANFIPELNISNPTSTDPKSEGDDHLRKLGRVLVGDGTANSGSFTPNFTGQYIGSADALNDISFKLISFNGRTQVAAVPVSNVDYSATGEGAGSGIAKLPDFTGWAGVQDGDVPLWKGDSFQPESLSRVVPEVVDYLHYDGVGKGQSSIFRVQFSPSAPFIDNITGSGVATINNNADFGFFITAVLRCAVTMTFYDGLSGNTGNQRAIVVDGNGVQPSNQPVGKVRARMGSTIDSITTQVILDPGSNMWINVDDNWQASPTASVQVVIAELVAPV